MTTHNPPAGPPAFSQAFSPCEHCSSPSSAALALRCFASRYRSVQSPSKLLQNPPFPTTLGASSVYPRGKGVSSIICLTFPVFPLSPVLTHACLSSVYNFKTCLGSFFPSFPSCAWYLWPKALLRVCSPQRADKTSVLPPHLSSRCWDGASLTPGSSNAEKSPSALIACAMAEPAGRCPISPPYAA